MTSKLDYLQKYLAKPNASACDAQDVKKRKQKDKDRTKDKRSLQIRDISDLLPDAKVQTKSSAKYKDPRKTDEIVFVEEEEVQRVAEAAKAEVQTSGVAWNIRMNRPGVQARQTHAPFKADVKDEDGESDGDLVLPRPPRQVTCDSPQKGSDADLSPPRALARANVNDDDLSPPRGAPQREADSDLSLPRGGAPRAPQRLAAGASDDDLSPRRPSKHEKCTSAHKQGSDADLSPPRRGLNVPGRSRHDSDADISPPRRGQEQTNRSNNCDADISPPRRNNKVFADRRNDSDSDISLPRREQANSDGAPSRQNQPHPAQADLSPPRRGGAPSTRRRHDSDADISPPRRHLGGGTTRHDSDIEDFSPARRNSEKSKNAQESEDRMSSGLRSGLVSGAQLKEEAAQVRRERLEKLESMADSETGRGADTVYRSKAGKRITREEWVEQNQKTKKKKLSDYPEQELEWGGGLKQTENKEAEKEELARVVAEPFARFAPDARYEDELINKERHADPMRSFAQDDEAHDSNEKRDVPREAPVEKKPLCPHRAPPNRFGILPGYRWDGKVRGNGYEAKYLKAKNDREHHKRAREEYMQLMD